MLMKLIVGVFERARSKLTSTRSRIPSDSDVETHEFNHNANRKLANGSLIIQQQPRLSLSKWLCTTPAAVERPNSASKSNKNNSNNNRVRRSSSWRSLKERGSATATIRQLTSRTLSFDELHRDEQFYQKSNSSRRRRDVSRSPMLSFAPKSSDLNPIRLSNCDGPPSLSSVHTRFDRLASTLVNYPETNNNQAQSQQQHHSSSKSHRRYHHHNHRNQPPLSSSRNNTASSGGGDSGYSEESFATTTLSSSTRPMHTSCPHCHCEQRSSFRNYRKPTSTPSTYSSTSDTANTHRENVSSDSYYRLFEQQQRMLSASRSYPHIKPLPKTMTTTSQPPPPPPQPPITQPVKSLTQQRRTRALLAKRRRHLSCDSSLWARMQVQQPNTLTRSPLVSLDQQSALQRHFTTIGMMHCDPSPVKPKTLSPLPTNTQVFGELNLAAIELDSLRTLDCHRASMSSSYSSSSSSSSPPPSSISRHRTSHRKRTFLVWHEYRNGTSSSTSGVNASKDFSVTRGDQVRLLRRVGKSTLLVQKEDDGSIGFIPQACLAHDEINSFLSVKGLRETVL